MSGKKVYVLTRNDEVYGVFETEQAAMAKAAFIVVGGWYEYGGRKKLVVDRAEWGITEQRMEVEG